MDSFAEEECDSGAEEEWEGDSGKRYGESRLAAASNGAQVEFETHQE
jgi:hypothetical protein